MAIDITNKEEKQIALTGTQIEETLLQAHLSKDAIGKINGLVASASEIDGVVAVNPKSISYNLANYEAFNQGKAIRSGTGALYDHVDYATSDFIEIEPNTDYYVQGLYYIAFYTQDYVMTWRFSTNEGKGVIKNSGSARFARISKYIYTTINITFAKSSYGVPYVPYGENYTDASVNGFIANYQDYIDNPIIPDLPEGIFRTDIAIADHSALSSTTYNYIYTLYDALVDNAWCKKTTLTPDKDGNPIYKYEFNAQRLTTPTKPRLPKVYIQTGVHGVEKTAIIALYYFFKNLKDNSGTNDFLDYLMYEVNYVVIPVVNPSGYNINERKNSNGVDINRNCGSSLWDSFVSSPSDATYKGTSAFSEIESKNIRTTLALHSDIDFFIDMHNFFSEDEFSYIEPYGIGGNGKLCNMASRFYGKLNRYYRKETTHSFITPLTYSFGTVVNNQVPTTANFAKEFLGVNACTFEICQKINKKADDTINSELTIRWGTELITNWIMTCIKNLNNKNF